MFGDDEGPKDWEMKDEEPPESLQKKWEGQEASGSRRVICPSCKKETSEENLTCIFCGATVLQECCPVLGLIEWIKSLFKRP